MPNPMTKPQRVTHFDMFSDACRANGWTFAGQRLVTSKPEDCHSTFARQSLAAATAVAERDGRPVLDDDLRHAVYFLATGKHSVWQLDSGRDTDRVFAWLNLMIDENDLDAAIVLGDPEAQDRKRLIWLIRHLADSAYLREILLDQGDPTTRLEDLPLPRLKQIAVTVTARSRSAAKRGTAISHVPQNAAMRSTSLALPKLPAQNAAEPTPPAQSPSGAPGTAAGATFHPVNSIPPSHEIPDDNCPF